VWRAEFAAKLSFIQPKSTPGSARPVKGIADVFSRGGKSTAPTEAELKELHAKIGRLAVANNFLLQGLPALPGKSAGYRVPWVTPP